MTSAPDLFDAHLKASVAAGHFLHAHAVRTLDADTASNRRKAAMEELDNLVAMFGLELVPRQEIKTR